MSGQNDFVYASLGAQLEVYKLEPKTDKFLPVQSLILDEIIQYAWSNRAGSVIYFICSGAGPMSKTKRNVHFVQAFRIATDGCLTRFKDPIFLGNRPLFGTLDQDESHLLLAYNNPSDVSVHQIDADGGIGQQVLQEPQEFGTTVHQVRLTPRGNIAVVPACAHHDTGDVAGRVDFFTYTDGLLSPLGRIDADPDRAADWLGIRRGAHGFSARHVDFHPTRSWMYLVVETQGELMLFDYDDNQISKRSRHIKDTLENVRCGESAQLASAIHVHPNGQFLYVSNRAWETVNLDGKEVFSGGANTIAVFELDQITGEPTLIQQVDTRGIGPRTFGIDAAGKSLVVGNQEARFIATNAGIARIAPSLVSFKIENDGKLTFQHQHDLPDKGPEDVCFWSTVLTIGPSENT